jgi:hypothetical protein
VTAVSRLAAGLVAPLLVISLAGCNGDDAVADTVKARAMSEAKGQAALLTLNDLGPGYKKQATDDAGDNEGMDCLSVAARQFDSVKAATELELEFRNKGPDGTLGQVSVQSGFSSYAEADRAEITLDELRGAMQDCRTAEYEEDDATIAFDISVTDEKTTDVLDQQVNVTLDGEITIGETVLPLVIELRYFRIDNHGGAVSVSLLNAPDQQPEIDRLVEIGVDRFVDVVAPAG